VAGPGGHVAEGHGGGVSGLLPEGTELGRLSLDEVFIDYEGPKLFSARNAVGQRYLAVAVDDAEDWVVFLYVPVSPARYLSVRSGLLPLRAAIGEPEETVWVARLNFVTGESFAEARDPAGIPEDWLPDEDAVLGVPTHTRDLFEPMTLQQRADGEVRSLFAVQLDRPDLMRTEYPLRDLNELLEDVQEAVHAMAAEAEGKATTTGAIPEHIVRDSELSMIDLQAASFVVVLAPTLGDRMVEMPLAGVAADRLMSLLEAAEADDDTTMKEAVASLEQRAFSKFRSLLEDLADTSASMNLYVAHPGRELRHTAVTPQQAGRGLAVMSAVSTTSQEVYIESAVLVGANVRTRAFELRDDETGAKYAGKVEKDAVAQVDGLQIGEAYRYSARVLVEESYGSSSSEPKVVHRLRMIRRKAETPDASPYGLVGGPGNA
jgi:hypothetical protein